MALYFMAGWIMHSCFTSLIQDFIGKEKYLKMTDENWIDKAVSIPFAIVGIIIALFLMVIK
jgi:hypothetical protein